MTSRYADAIGRVPGILLFSAAALVQIALIGAMVFDRTQILRDGVEIKLATRPVDPRDFLRGDYIVLSYNISSVPTGDLKDKPAPGRRALVYVKLVPKENGFYEAVSVHEAPVPVGSGEVLIQGRVTSGATCGGRYDHIFCDQLTISYGLENYFVPEGEGRDIERARNDRQADTQTESRVAVIAAVTPTGRAAIKRLLIDGMPVYDEPMF